MPEPVSETRTMIRSFSGAALTMIEPSSGVYRTALSMRFSNTRSHKPDVSEYQGKIFRCIHPERDLFLLSSELELLQDVLDEFRQGKGFEADLDIG